MAAHSTHVIFGADNMIKFHEDHNDLFLLLFLKCASEGKQRVHFPLRQESQPHFAAKKIPQMRQ